MTALKARVLEQRRGEGERGMGDGEKGRRGDAGKGRRGDTEMRSLFSVDPRPPPPPSSFSSSTTTKATSIWTRIRHADALTIHVSFRADNRFIGCHFLPTT